MNYNAKGGRLIKDDAVMDYVQFGNGPKALLAIIGLGDGLHTVKGSAKMMGKLLGPVYGENFTVYMISRREPLPKDFSTRDMAEDYAWAMRELGITEYTVLGISQGGMIAQWLTAMHQKTIHRLVLAVTYPATSTIAARTIGEWKMMAIEGKFVPLYMSICQKSYTAAFMKKNGFMMRLMAFFMKTKHMERFIVQADSCLSHHCDVLNKITCPVLILGGKEDQIVGVEGSEKLHTLIPQSEIYLYEGYGHGIYDECPDFHPRVAEFLNQ